MLQFNDTKTKSIPPVDMGNMVFVFGSNLSGVHGAGAARYAHKFRGATPGKGIGRQGMSYAIPTKDLAIRTLPLDQIRDHVEVFLAYARSHPQTEFQVTCIGCGLAGYRNNQIAPMFAGATGNCLFDTLWKPWLHDVRFWGTL